MSAKWFDEKYRDGQIPTLEDTLQITQELRFPLSERTRRLMERKLRDELFALNDEYKPSRHIIVHSLLLNTATFLGLESKRYKKYVKRYGKIMDRYEGEVNFLEYLT